MTFTTEQLDELKRPLERRHVAERTQAGRTLSYIEGWHAIAEANRIFGFDAWTRETVEIKCVMEKERTIGRAPNTKDGWGVSYIARVRVTVRPRNALLSMVTDGTATMMEPPVIREGVGTGHGIDVDLGQAHESAIKEAETDAMKRALMTFGNPFGLALYDKTQANVAAEWKGPLKVTALKDALRAISRDVLACDDEGSLDDIMKKAKPVIEQAKHDLPDWIEGDGGDIRGLRSEVEMMRAEFKSRDAMKQGYAA
ncbi:MAG: RAD52 family DNA repair protein [Candidatus Limnocylindrus sp.]